MVNLVKNLQSSRTCTSDLYDLMWFWGWFIIEFITLPVSGRHRWVSPIQRLMGIMSRTQTSALDAQRSMWCVPQTHANIFRVSIIFSGSSMLVTDTAKPLFLRKGVLLTTHPSLCHHCEDQLPRHVYHRSSQLLFRTYEWGISHVSQYIPHTTGLQS